MFKIIFLGTSAAVPTAQRSLPAILVKHEGQRFLVDCGEGTQLRLLQAGESFKIPHIFLTHDHLDHILGLGGLFFSISLLRMEPTPRIKIYGGRTTLSRVKSLAAMIRSAKTGQAHVQLEYVKASPGIVFESDKLAITAFSTSHRKRRPSFGYIFQTKQTGIKAVFMGDTRYTFFLAKATNEADCLVSEANFAADETDLAGKVGHLTAAQAARIATEAGAKCLMLNHVSRKYADNPEKILAEAKAIFPNTLLPNDLDCFEITHHGVRHVQQT